MIYGTTTIEVLANTLIEVRNLAQVIYSYPGTDLSDKADLGRPPTTIACTLIAKTDAQRILIHQLMHSATEENLIFGTYYYKEVVPGKSNKSKLKTPDEKTWYIDAEFTALDPIPYSVSTDTRLY